MCPGPVDVFDGHDGLFAPSVALGTGKQNRTVKKNDRWMEIHGVGMLSGDLPGQRQIPDSGFHPRTVFEVLLTHSESWCCRKSPEIYFLFLWENALLQCLNNFKIY
jgi:hypothetical protein